MIAFAPMVHRAIAPRRNAAIALSLGVIASIMFVVLTAMVIEHETGVRDRVMILSLRSEASPVLTAFLLAVTFTSGKLAIPALILCAAVLYRQNGARTAAYYVASCVCSELLDAILMLVFARVRPLGVSPLLTAAGGYSYPSADAKLAVVIFGLGALLLTWSIRSAALRLTTIGAAGLFVVAAAIARVYLGAHW